MQRLNFFFLDREEELIIKWLNLSIFWQNIKKKKGDSQETTLRVALHGGGLLWRVAPPGSFLNCQPLRVNFCNPWILYSL